MSISTGPGLPEMAVCHASLSVSASLVTSLTIQLRLVTVLVISTVFTSWKLSLPRREVATLPVMAITGTESRYAVASPVMMLVEPGPDVAMTTPGRPLDLA